MPYSPEFLPSSASFPFQDPFSFPEVVKRQEMKAESGRKIIIVNEI
jgi:hypothetical protein